jgi:hypothetical protein
MIPCVSQGEKRGAVNTRTEYNALRSVVIRCGDGPETFLACSVLQIYSTKKRISTSVLSDERKKEQRTHPYTRLDLPSLNLQLIYLTYSSIPTSTIMKRKDIKRKVANAPESQPRSSHSPRLILGNPCLSEKRNNGLLFPTDGLAMRSNLTLMSSCD